MDCQMSKMVITVKANQSTYYVLWDKEVKVHGIFTNSGKFLSVHEFMTHSQNEAYDKNECVPVA